MPEQMNDDDRLNSINDYISLIPSEFKDRVSDGYHTFGQLYKHRTVLFACIANIIDCTRSCKSKLQSDGTMYEGYFIVVADLDDGQISYHVPLKYWDIFHVREVDIAPEWDGHTPDDVLDRLISQFCIG